MKATGLENTSYLDGQEHFHISQGQVGTAWIKLYFKRFCLTVGQVLHAVQFYAETLNTT